jgi:hypothetical protein
MGPGIAIFVAAFSIGQRRPAAPLEVTWEMTA